MNNNLSVLIVRENKKNVINFLWIRVNKNVFPVDFFRYYQIYNLKKRPFVMFSQHFNILCCLVILNSEHSFYDLFVLW